MKKRKLDWFSGSLIAVVLAAFIIYGGDKAPLPSAVVYWDDPFNGYSYVIDTNDLHHITFDWNAPPVYIPLDARAEISAIHLHDIDTPDLFVVTNVSMYAFGASVWMPDEATNYAYYVECKWQPPPSVVTNGVYHVRANKTGERVVPIGLKVKFDDHEIGGNKK